MRPSPVDVDLYTRAGCGLCDDARWIMESVAKDEKISIVIREVDIDQDPELRARYGEDIPVVFVGGEKAFEHRVDPDGFARVIRRMSRPGRPRRLERILAPFTRGGTR